LSVRVLPGAAGFIDVAQPHEMAPGRAPMVNLRLTGLAGSSIQQPGLTNSPDPLNNGVAVWQSIDPGGLGWALMLNNEWLSLPPTTWDRGETWVVIAGKITTLRLWT
jgi:hypothetical protein